MRRAHHDLDQYFLVEGDCTEAKLYRRWIGHALPHLSEVHLVSDLTGDRFYIISGGSYPSYVDRIRDSLLDIKDHPAVEHFFICIDSEEWSYEEKLAEITEELARAERDTRVRDGSPHFRSHVIVQHCCAETWFLGHRRMMTRNPTSPNLLRSSTSSTSARPIQRAWDACPATSRAPPSTSRT